MKRIILSIFLMFAVTLSIAQSGSFDQFKFEGKYYLNVQFEELPTQKEKAAIEGLEFINYQGNNAFLCAVSANKMKFLTNRTDFSFLPPKDSSKKLTIEMEEAVFGKSDTDELEFVIQFTSDISAEKVNEIVASKKLETVESFDRVGVNSSVVKGAINEIYQLIELPIVVFIDLALRESDIEPLNYEQGNIMNGSFANMHPDFGYKGEGVVIGVGDSGKLGEHIDMDDRILFSTEEHISGWGDHGDHCTGTAGGAGNLNPKLEGIASGCELIIQKSSQINVHAEEYIADYGMNLTSNSYGSLSSCSNYGYYTYTSRNYDELIYNNSGLSILFAAGNDGGSQCGDYPVGFHTVLRSYSTAKNVITVGNIDKNENIAYGSSRGPVDDGRIKPEICGVGQDILSTSREYNYVEKGGTSMATPAVSGVAALLYEAGVQSSALIKGILCNSADDYGNPGPDFKHGFGLVNARKAILTFEEHRFVENMLDQGGIQSLVIDVPTNAQGVKVMLYWHDPKGQPEDLISLVNNLDLTVEDGNTIHYPLILDPLDVNVENNAFEGVDSINNIEQCSFDLQGGNSITVNVEGTAVPEGPQKYVVVYEFVQDDLVLTYPVGGENYVPGETERIQWENDGAVAGATYDVQFSTDGSSWSNLATGLTNTIFDWTIPANVTSQAQIRVLDSQGNVSTSGMFDIIGVPQNTYVDCGTLHWDAVDGALFYEIYILDGPYMELVEAVQGTEYHISYDNGDSEDWIAVAARVIGGNAGRRSIALEFKADDCPQITGAQAYHYSDWIGNKYVNINWDSLTDPNVYGYNVKLVYGVGACCGAGGDIFEENYFTGTNGLYTIPIYGGNCCFSYIIEPLSACGWSNCFTTAYCYNACEVIVEDDGDSRKNAAEILIQEIEIYPNPSLKTVNVSLNQPQEGRTNISIYSAEGKLVDTLIDKILPEGKSNFVWNRNGEFPAGLYHIVVSSKESRETYQIMLVD